MPIVFSASGALYIVLDEENIKRIQANDPCDITPNITKHTGPLRLPPEIIVAYATHDEYAAIANMQSAEEVVKYLRRGVTITASDHERPIFVEQKNKKMN